jgi:hypothetical protein
VQLNQFHRLDQDLICAHTDSAGRFVGACLSAENHNRNRGLHFLGLTQQLRSIAIRQIQIEDDCLRLKPAKLDLRIVTAGDVADNVPLSGQIAADTGTDDGIDINNQNSLLTQAFTCPDDPKGRSTVLVTISDRTRLEQRLCHSSCLPSCSTAGAVTNGQIDSDGHESLSSAFCVRRAVMLVTRRSAKKKADLYARSARTETLTALVSRRSPPIQNYSVQPEAFCARELQRDIPEKTWIVAEVSSP